MKIFFVCRLFIHQVTKAAKCEWASIIHLCSLTHTSYSIIIWLCGLQKTVRLYAAYENWFTVVCLSLLHITIHMYKY